MTNSATSGGPLNRIVLAWGRFWFTPADPTPLAFMRIVVGLLAIYVHVAYSFDLESFFGPHAWYDQGLANRIRQSYPLVLPSPGWTDPEIYYRLPNDVGTRKAVRTFLNNLFKEPIEPQLEFMRSLSGSADERAALMRWLRTLPDDRAERDALLQRYVTDKVTTDERNGLPNFLILQPNSDAREQLVRATQRFLPLLPQSIHERQQLFTLFQDLPASDWYGLQIFISDLPKDEAKRAFTLDYLEFWNIDPKYTYKIGVDTYSPWFHITDPRLMWALHLTHIAVMVLFTLGLWTRVTSVLSWLAGLAYVNRAQPVLFGQDTMMNLCLFYLMLAPCGAVWSLDWLIARYRNARKLLKAGKSLVGSEVVEPLISAGFVIRLLQIQYCLMYLSAGLAKLKGQTWWTGTAPMACLANPEFAPMHMSIYRDFMAFLCQHRWLWEIHMNMVVVFTLVIEIGFPTLVWTRMRPILVAGALLLHVGIAAIMGLSVFSLFMFALLICWIPPDVIRWFFARRPAELAKWRLKYHHAKPEQAELTSKVYALDVWNQVEYVDHDAAKFNTPVPTVKLEPIGRSGPVQDAAPAVVESFGIFSALSWLPGVKLLARQLLSPRMTTPVKAEERTAVGAGR